MIERGAGKGRVEEQAIATVTSSEESPLIPSGGINEMEEISGREGSLAHTECSRVCRAWSWESSEENALDSTRWAQCRGETVKHRD